MEVFGRIATGLGALICAAAIVQPHVSKAEETSPVNDFLMQESRTMRTDSEVVFPKYLSIAGTDVGGMTYEQVEELITEYADDRVNRHVTWMVLGKSFEYEMDDFGMTWNNPEMVETVKDYLLEGNFVEQYTKQKELEVNPVNLEFDFSFDEEILNQRVDDYVATFTCDPENASVELVDGNFQIVEEITGRDFDASLIKSEILAQMSDFTQSETLVYDFPHTDTDPQYKGEVFQYSFSILGEATTRDLGEESRRGNIELSASRINGKVLYPGEQFSALTWYGEVTEEGGYGEAPTYQDGQQIPGVGGGICQTTTTLYDALLYAEMGIGYRSPHSMLVAYVPPSMDAMVDYATGADFLAYNNSDYPIYFQAFVEGDSLTIRVWGNETRPANRTVSYDYAVLELEYPNPLYAAEPVNDEVCKRGAYYVGEKIYEEVAPHPYVKSQLWKTVTVDGQVTEHYVVKPEHGDSASGYDDYRMMSGVIYHASDCVVTNYLVNDANAYLGKRIHHDVRFPNGVEWNEFAYQQNMGG